MKFYGTHKFAFRLRAHGVAFGIDVSEILIIGEFDVHNQHTIRWHHQLVIRFLAFFIFGLFSEVDSFD